MNRNVAEQADQSISELVRADPDRPSLRPFVILEICKYGAALIVLYVVAMFTIPYLKSSSDYLAWLFDPEAQVPADSENGVETDSSTGFTEFSVVSPGGQKN